MKRKTSSQSKKGGALQPSSLSSEKGRRNQNNMLQKESGYVSREPKAPVKKIPNVHSSSLPGSTGHSSAPVDPAISRQLLQERQRNKILQLEVERLRKSLEICKKTLNEKTNEIEGKNKLINKLMEDKMRIDASNDVIEENIDIDNLLNANLGEGDVDLDDILNMSTSAFPEDLGGLDINSMMQEQSLCLSPGSLDLATNTAYVVDEMPVQFPNREGSMESDEDGTVKTLVGRMVEQKKTSNTFDNQKKVSPLKIIRGGNQFKVVDKKRSRGESFNDVPEKKPKPSGKVLPDAPQCLACSSCSKKFPLGGQWALERHVAAAHGEDSRDKNCCQYCDKKFIYESCLAAHIRWHVATNPWQCGNCDYKIDGLEKFVKHVRGVHGVNSVENARKLLVSSSH